MNRCECGGELIEEYVFYAEIDGFPDYGVSQDGEVVSCRVHRSNPNGEWRALKLCKDGNGYLIVNLYKGGKRKTYKVHRLVAEAFIGPCPEGYECNHKDGDKLNNRLDNLEWVTRRENIRHAIDTGLMNNRGSNHYKSKLSERDVIVIRILLGHGDSYAVVAGLFGVHKGTIRAIDEGRSWDWLEQPVGKAKSIFTEARPRTPSRPYLSFCSTKTEH